MSQSSSSNAATTPAQPQVAREAEFEQLLEGKEGVDLDLMVFALSKNTQRRTKIFELLIYIPFILLFLAYIHHGKTPIFPPYLDAINEGYWMTWAFKENLLDNEVPDVETKKSYYDIRNFGEYWEWLDGVLLPELFNDEQPETMMRHYNIANRLIGAMRVRQIRVTPNVGCTYLEDYKTEGVDDNCYPAYSADVEAKDDFGSPMTFQWGDCEANGGGSMYASKRQSYDCTGYSVLFPFNMTQEEALDLSKEMQESEFLDKQTRFIVHEFFTYNPNLNFFTAIKIGIEVTQGGGVIPTWDFKSFKTELFVDVRDYVHLAVACLFVLYTVYYTVLWIRMLVIRIRRGEWWAHFLNVWSLVELASLTMIYISFVTRAIFVFRYHRSGWTPGDYVYPPLEGVVSVFTFDVVVNSINCIIVFFKIFKFFKLHDRLNLLAKTVAEAASQLGGVGISLVICLLAFAIAGNFVFGYDMDGFKDIVSSLSSLLRILVGDIEYIEMRDQNRSLFPLFFVAFMILGFLLILNMFVAVINDAFASVNANVLDSGFGFSIDSIVDEVQKRLKYKRGDEQELRDPAEMAFNHGDEEVVSLLQEFQDRRGRGALTHKDVMAALNCSEELALQVVSRFDSNGDGCIDAQDLQTEEDRRAHEMLRTMTSKKSQLDVEDEEDIIAEESLLAGDLSANATSPSHRIFSVTAPAAAADDAAAPSAQRLDPEQLSRLDDLESKLDRLLAVLAQDLSARSAPAASPSTSS